MKLGLTLAPLAGRLDQPVENSVASFRERRGWLVSVLFEGVRGLGEASPLSGYSSDTAEQTEAALRALGSTLEVQADTLEAFTRSVLEHSERLPREAYAARFGLESALFDAYARFRAVPLWAVLRHGLELAQRDAQVPTRLSVAAWITSLQLDDARARFDEGSHTFKLKLGRDLDAELAFAKQVRERFPAARLRFDANGALSGAALDATLSALGGLDIEFLEEPSRVLPARSPVPLALDESLRGLEPEDVIDHPDVRAWVLKPTALGGLLETARFVREAQARGLDAVVSHTLEGPVARATLGELALAIGSGVAVGLGDHPGLRALVPPFEVHAPAFAAEGYLAPHQTPGFGHVEVDLSIREAARQHPTRAALVGPGFVLTYAQLAERCADRVAAFEAQGVRAGDTVAFVPTLDVAGVVTILAAIEAGICVVTLHPRATEEEHERVVRESGATLLDQRSSRLAHGEAAREVRPEAPLAILFTSGTTGSPKGAVLPRRAFVASAWASRARLAEGHGPLAEAHVDRWLLSLTPAHIGGLSIIVRMLVTRGTVVLAGAPDFDPRSFRGLIDDLGVTHVSLVPTMLSRLLDAGFEAPATLRTVLLGGAAVEPALVARARAAGLPVRATYGMTEACAPITTQASHDEPGCGRPLDGLEVRSREGVLEVRGATLFSGYLGQREHLDEQGWFRTGDLGRVDEHGFVHVEGRRHDLIVSGGENVYPAEVEARLAEQPDISEAAVFGVYDETWGQRVVAACVLRPLPAGAGEDEPSDPQARVRTLDAALAGVLARFKLPKEYWVVDALPRTSLDKVARSRLQTLSESPGTVVVDVARLRSSGRPH
ncbi:MAG: AMP-binding protein [Sandaracinaceae bacterium]|nr:AMP-binding protein [Sandaracinaceae bacterium]